MMRLQKCQPIEPASTLSPVGSPMGPLKICMDHPPHEYFTPTKYAKKLVTS
jgi:hypothetical protein